MTVSITEIGKRLKETEVKQRKDYLIRNLKRIGVYQTKDGRSLESLRLAELEWIYIEEKNDELREEFNY